MALKLIGEAITNLNNGTHLDTVTKTGVYIQHLNANALPELGYPTNAAGLLEVHTAKDMAFQRYTTYKILRGVWVRSLYLDTWSEWKQLVTS